MKKIGLLLILLTVFSSCEIDDNLNDTVLEILPVESFEVPESFVLNQTYEIKLKYIKPTSCHYVDGIYFEKNGNIRIIGIQSTIIKNDDCIEYETLTMVERSFNFKAEMQGSYLFKFYKGIDENGNGIFEVVDIPVNYLEYKK